MYQWRNPAEHGEYGIRDVAPAGTTTPHTLGYTTPHRTSIIESSHRIAIRIASLTRQTRWLRDGCASTQDRRPGSRAAQRERRGTRVEGTRGNIDQAGIWQLS